MCREQQSQGRPVTPRDPSITDGDVTEKTASLNHGPLGSGAGFAGDVSQMFIVQAAEPKKKSCETLGLFAEAPFQLNRKSRDRFGKQPQS